MRFPPIRIDYLKSFTDDTGIFQHAKFSTPKRSEGYTTDDNARALIACARYSNLRDDSSVEALANVYLAFLYHMQRSDGRFHNYLTYQREFADEIGSADCMGRALWSCGCVMNSNLPNDMKLVAKEIFDKGFRWVWETPVRSYAHVALGLSQYSQVYPDDNTLIASIQEVANCLLQHYHYQASGGWKWFEPHLTYDNARLPHALFEAYKITRKQEYLQVAKESLDFLLDIQMLNGHFVPIGNDGWCKRDGPRALYDQQPIEASAMVEATLAAFHVTNNERYTKAARIVFQWFLGKNTLKAMMYNPKTGGCFDGITPICVNLNQGAESSISYLLARLKLEELKSAGSLKKESNPVVDLAVKSFCDK